MKAHLLACIERGDIAAKDVGLIAPLRIRAEAPIGTSLDCIEQVRLGDSALCVDLNPAEIARSLAVSPDRIAAQVLSLQPPFTQRRRGVESRLIIGVPHPVKDDILIANVARAEQWRMALYKGDDLATIAARDGVPVKYLGQMLPFAFLSPKLVRSILEGRQPSAMTTNWIRRRGLPASWVEQDRIVAQL